MQQREGGSVVDMPGWRYRQDIPEKIHYLAVRWKRGPRRADDGEEPMRAGGRSQEVGVRRGRFISKSASLAHMEITREGTHQS